MSALRSLLCTAGLALAACATAPAPDDIAAVSSPAKLDAAEQRGHDFAVRRCSACHAVGLDGSGAQNGPAFRRLATRYNPISLERRFTEVPQHGVERMPPNPMTRGEAEDLIAYLATLH
jgi:mono/diheme cytochrome c family protein